MVENEKSSVNIEAKGSAGGPSPLDVRSPSVPKAVRRNGLMKGRSIHLLDIENLLGTPHFSKSDVLALANRYQVVAKPQAGALLVAATSSKDGIITTALAWPDIRHGWRPGHDGADLVLLDVLQDERVSDRFESVVIASGDGIFAAPVADLRRRGVHVTVIARTNALSANLRYAAGSDRCLPIDMGNCHDDS